MKRIALFAAKCLGVSLAAAALLFLLNLRYKQVMENPYSDADKFHFMSSNYTDIQICNIGSSHGEYAFDYQDLTKRLGYQCFNFAMSSQTYNYDYAILSMYKKNFSDQCLMFIPISYFSFNNEVIDEEEEQFLNGKYYTFLSPRYIPDYNPYMDIITHYLPVLAAGEDIVKILPSLSLQVLAAQADANVQTGTPAVSPANNPELEAEFQEKAQNRYHRHMDNKDEYFLPERINNLYDILAFCKDNGITAVLITTPYTSFYSDLFAEDFKEEFRSTITEIAEKSGVPYYDYSEDERFSGMLNYFSDADHLNTEGAALFMETIEKEIPEFREFLLHTAPNGD